mmetsp:Transcript_38547/g.28409  ORF Transcript_38547/g.28409 Transcript_38547/m.28409 type:complete len:113 (+) Transcript_38547:1068-1406(+)
MVAQRRKQHVFVQLDSQSQLLKTSYVNGAELELPKEQDEELFDKYKDKIFKLVGETQFHNHVHNSEPFNILKHHSLSERGNRSEFLKSKDLPHSQSMNFNPVEFDHSDNFSS